MKGKLQIKYEIDKKQKEVKEISSKINFGRWNDEDRNLSQRKQHLCVEISALEWVLN